MKNVNKIAICATAGIIAGLSLIAAGCKKPEGTQPTAQASAMAPDLHTTTGIIRGVRDGGKVLVIEHQAFPNFMEAMTMGFELKDPAMGKDLKVGDKVEFSIQATGDAFPIVQISKVAK